MTSPDETNIVRVTDKTYCSTATEDSVYCFFVDEKLLYYCHTVEQALDHLEDIVKDLEAKYKKTHPEHRVFIEKKNDWTFIVQRARDGIVLSGKPKQTHVVEIRRAQKLLKPVKLS